VSAKPKCALSDGYMAVQQPISARAAPSGRAEKPPPSLTRLRRWPFATVWPSAYRRILRARAAAGVSRRVVFAGKESSNCHLNHPDKTAEVRRLDVQRFYRLETWDEPWDGLTSRLLCRTERLSSQNRAALSELGESSITSSVPGVRDAAAMRARAASGERVLVAFVVMADVADKAEQSAGHAPCPRIRRHIPKTRPDDYRCSFLLRAKNGQLGSLCRLTGT